MSKCSISAKTFEGRKLTWRGYEQSKETLNIRILLIQGDFTSD